MKGLESAKKIMTRVVFLANRTTLVELRDGRRIFGEKKEIAKVSGDASFIEMIEGGLKLDVPPRMCSQGHRLEFEIEIKVGIRVIHFPVQGIVDHIESNPHGNDSVTVKFTRYDRAVWSVITGLYRERQQSVADLFQRLRGA